MKLSIPLFALCTQMIAVSTTAVTDLVGLTRSNSSDYIICSGIPADPGTHIVPGYRFLAQKTCTHLFNTVYYKFDTDVSVTVYASETDCKLDKNGSPRLLTLNECVNIGLADGVSFPIMRHIGGCHSRKICADSDPCVDVPGVECEGKRIGDEVCTYQAAAKACVTRCRTASFDQCALFAAECTTVDWCSNRLVHLVATNSASGAVIVVILIIALSFCIAAGIILFVNKCRDGDMSINRSVLARTRGRYPRPDMSTVGAEQLQD